MAHVRSHVCSGQLQAKPSSAVLECQDARVFSRGAYIYVVVIEIVHVHCAGQHVCLTLSNCNWPHLYGSAIQGLACWMRAKLPSILHTSSSKNIKKIEGQVIATLLDCKSSSCRGGTTRGLMWTMSSRTVIQVCILLCTAGQHMQQGVQCTSPTSSLPSQICRTTS
jgi:hypothetical protein